MTVSEMTSIDIADIVRPYVAKTTIGDITLWLDESHIKLQNDYWRIPIRPSREPEKLFPYFEALADLTIELQDTEGIKVSISPGEPLTED